MKKTCFIVLFTFFLYNVAWSQWAQKANFGGDERSGVAGFVINSKLYIRLGFNYFDSPQFKKDFWEYDPATDIWTQKADFGGTERSIPVGFSIGNKGYIGTGSNNDNTYKDFWEYDPATDTWTQKADFEGITRDGAVGFSIDNKGYIGTGDYWDGSNSYFYKDFWEYDPTTDTWTQKTDFNGTARAGAVGFSIGNKLYFGTGRDGSSFYKDFWEYDPTTDIWTQKADFNGIARAGAVSFSIGNKGYIGTGGGSGSVYFKDFWEYDPATDTWLQKANFGGASRDNAIGISIANRGYIGTGFYFNINPYYLNDFWEYDPLADGIEDELSMAGNEISISPNPTTGKINLQLPQHFGVAKTLEIYNCMGQLQRVQNDISTIDISTLSSGLYFFTVSNNKGEALRGKVIKQ